MRLMLSLLQRMQHILTIEARGARAAGSGLVPLNIRRGRPWAAGAVVPMRPARRGSTRPSPGPGRKTRPWLRRDFRSDYTIPQRFLRNHSAPRTSNNRAASQGLFQIGLGGILSTRTCRPAGRSRASRPIAPKR